MTRFIEKKNNINNDKSNNYRQRKNLKYIRILLMSLC